MDGLYLITLIVSVFCCYHQQWAFGGSNALCYSEGKAFRCVPPFINIVENMIPIEITSTCGETKKQRICVDQTNCHSCMKHSHSGKYLTDQHLNHNITYWASDYVQPGDHVNITFALGKLFEIYYISLVLIPHLEPDSVALYKSLDYGKSWIVWHYFSKDCLRSFGLPTSDQMNQFVESKFGDNGFDSTVKCSTIQNSNQPNLANSKSVLAFTTNNPHILTHSSDSHNTWMSATNIRIVLSRFDFFNTHFDGFTYPPILKQYFNSLLKKNLSSSKLILNKKMMEKNNTSPSLLHMSEFFSLADISVGGRCQCFGHAGKCLRNNIDHLFFCDCQHNTDGKDCKQCREGFVDKPWTAATAESAGECKRCHCNLHSKKCSFDKELFILSNKHSGGVCVDCEHNTAGRYCHYCKNGYYRDWSKPLSHQHVCLKCRCHPIGSTFPDKCDQRNSQCVCKKGVTGLSCNRCQKGYQQTKSPIQPCIETFDLHKVQMAQAPDNKCQHCNNKRKRIRFKKYCRKDAVLLVTMQSREQHKDMFRFEMKINYVYKIDLSVFSKLQPDFIDSFNNIIKHQYTHSTYPLWIREVDFKCGCPSLQLGMTYLVILKLHTINYLNRSELFLNQKSVALAWQKTWERRMKKFSNQEHQGQCVKWSAQHRHRRKYRHLSAIV